MLISFIITYYNEPIPMLRQCIESILAVSLRDDEREIILVDDGSKHSPMVELGSIADHITYVRQENGGLSSARNHGISLAKGEYLQFIDSDDYFISQNYNQIIHTVRNTNADVVMFRFSMKDIPYSTDYRNVDVGKCWKGNDYMCHNNLRGASWCYIFRRDFLGELRFREGMLHEDGLFTAQLIIKAQSLYDINIPAYYYRQHEGTIMSNRDKNHIQRRLNDHFFLIKYLNERMITMQGTDKRAMQRCVNQFAMGYIYFIVILTRNIKEYKRRTKELRNINLYPLPLAPYNLKYIIFSLCTRLL